MNKRILFLLLVIILFGLNKSFAQQLTYAAIGGITFGGPIPTKIEKNSFGSPKAGALAGLQLNYRFTKKVSLNLQLNYAYKGVTYSANYRKDTVIPQVINNTTIHVQSFYTAYANGDMGLHYLELHLMPAYKLSQRHTLMGGAYFSYLMGGFDSGKVQVVIGEGGFYGDYFENFNNINSITKLDIGFSLGMKSYWYKSFFSGFNITRSVRNIYATDIFSKRGLSTNTLFNTYCYLYFGIDI